MEDLDDLERFIDSIQYVGRMLKRNDRNQALPYEMTKTQWFILRILRKRSFTIGELAKKLEVRPSSMSQMIDRMELSGLVRRQTDSADARSKTVVLNEEGKVRLETISHNRMELLSVPFSQLSEEERIKIVELMEKFKSNLSASFDYRIDQGDKK